MGAATRPSASSEQRKTEKKRGHAWAQARARRRLDIKRHVQQKEDVLVRVRVVHVRVVGMVRMVRVVGVRGIIKVVGVVQEELVEIILGLLLNIELEMVV